MTRRRAATAEYGSAAPAGRDFLPRSELVFALVASFNYWTDLLRIAFHGSDSAALIFKAIHFSFYGAFALLILHRLPASADLIRRTPAMAAFLLLPLASTLWSVNADETLTRAIGLAGGSLYAYYLAARFDARQILKLLAWTAAAAAAVSLVLIFAFPSVGLMTEGDYVDVWSGAFIHKNGLGQMTALGVIISVIVLAAEGVRRNGIVAVGLGLNLFLLAGSRSLTAQVVCVAVLIMVFTVGRFLRFVVRHGALIAVCVAPVAVLAAALLTSDHLLQLLALAGKNATMSSRVPLWEILFGFIEDRYWLGWGYEAFFTDANFAIRVIESKLHFKPFYAHNGYIELWLGLGALGFAWMAALFVRFTWRAASAVHGAPHDPLHLLCFAYVPLFLMQNTAEATILQRNSMSWCLFVLLFVLLAKAQRQEHPAASPLYGQPARRRVTAHLLVAK